MLPRDTSSFILRGPEPGSGLRSLTARLLMCLGIAWTVGGSPGVASAHEKPKRQENTTSPHLDSPPQTDSYDADRNTGPNSADENYDPSNFFAQLPESLEYDPDAPTPLTDSDEITDADRDEVRRAYENALKNRAYPIGKERVRLGRKYQFSQLDNETIANLHFMYDVGAKFLADKRLEIRQEVLEDAPHYALPKYEETLDHTVENILHQRINDNLLKTAIPGKGRIELNSIRQTEAPHARFIFIRVIEERSGVAIIYIDYEGVEIAKKHWKKVIGRQHFGAQRPTVHVLLEDGKPREIEFGAIPHMFQRAYYEENWNAIVQANNTADKVIGGICMVLEMGLMACVDGAASSMNKASYAVKMFFGVGLGMYGTRTFQNWVEMFPRLSTQLMRKVLKIAKRNLPSLIFGTLLMGTEQGFAALNPTTLSGIWMWTLMISNFTASNLLKDEVSEWVEGQSRLRLNSGVNGDVVILKPRKKGLKVKVPFVDWVLNVWYPKEGFKFVGARKSSQLQLLRVFTGALRYLDIKMISYFVVLTEMIQSAFPDVHPSFIYVGAFVASKSVYVSTPLLPMWWNWYYYQRHFLAVQKTYEENPTPENKNKMANALEVAKFYKDRFERTLSFIARLPQNSRYLPKYFYQKLNDYLADRHNEKAVRQIVTSELEEVFKVFENEEEMFAKVRDVFASFAFERIRSSDADKIAEMLPVLFNYPKNREEQIKEVTHEILSLGKLEYDTVQERIELLRLSLEEELHVRKILAPSESIRYRSAIALRMNALTNLYASHGKMLGDSTWNALVSDAIGVGLKTRTVRRISDPLAKIVAGCQSVFAWNATAATP